jgi:mannose-1-phosphate guanylyltransferase/phosphomannomutase
MKAIIMAGGEGSRLRPLTCACPKPMVPLMDRPVMAYALDLLKKHGITQIGVTLQYLPERVTEYFGDGSDMGVELSYFIEDKPLGTAGSVRQAEEFLKEPFVVLSGDGLTDCDLTQAIAFHKDRGALATMVLKKVENPLEYGVVVADAQGRVARFLEKPGWGEVCSDTVNTGIYILEPEVVAQIPADRPYDFGREMFPALVEKGQPVFGYVMRGYWCDIGDVSAYVKAHGDIMDGRVAVDIPFKPGAVTRQAGARIDRSAVLEGPCFVGEGASIEAGARIGAYSVLGAGCAIKAGASIKRGIIWRGAQVGEGAQIRGGIVQTGGTVGDRASIFEESALGDGSALGENCILMPGVKVWPHKEVACGAKIDQNLVWGALSEADSLFAPETPSQAVRLAQAYAAALKPGSVVIGRDNSLEALAQARAMTAGLIAQGAQAVELGAATLPQTAHCVRAMGAGGGMYVARNSLTLLSEGGASPTRAQMRTLSGVLAREDYARAYSARLAAPIAAGASDRQYLASMTDGIDLAGVRVQMFAPGEAVLTMAERALSQAGCTVRAEWELELMGPEAGEIGLWFDETGENVRFGGENGALSEAENQQILVWTAIEMGARRLMMPPGMTRSVAQYAADRGAAVERVSSDRAQWMRALLAQDERLLRLHFDGVYAALKALDALKRSGLTVAGLIKSMPPVFRSDRAVAVELKDRGALLRRLAENVPGASLSDGVSFENEQGWAWISAPGEKKECRVLAEAASAEFAEELCNFCAGSLEKLLRDTQS